MAKGWEIEGLKPGLPLSECARLIITTKFREAFSYQNLVRTSEDIEIIHDMRVSLRRLWAAMSSFAHYFCHKKKFFSLSKQTRQLARKLGKVRDLDVLIELFEKHSKELQGQSSATLAIRYIISDCQVQRLQHRTKLFKYLEKLNRKEFERKFLAFFDTLNQTKIKTFVNKKREGKVFLKTLKNFYQHNPKDNFDSETLHEFRIAAKKLRYSLEFFEMCFNAVVTQELKTLKDIQETLGDLHDCDVIMELLNLHRRKINKNAHQEIFLGLRELEIYFHKKRDENLISFQELWQEGFQENFFTELKTVLSPKVQDNS